MKITAVRPFQIDWGSKQEGRAGPGAGDLGALVRIETDEGIFGLGEASPMQGGHAALGVIARECAPFLIGKDPLDHAVLIGRLWHKLVKLGPEGIATSALAALDIALWDIRGKAAGLPLYKMLGGAWRDEVPMYASVGGNSRRTVDEVVRVVAARVEAENPAAVKIRWDGDRTTQDADIPGDIAKARAVRKLLGDDFTIGFDANNLYSVGGAMRVGRALEDLGYAWFEEPVQHYHVRAMGEVAQRLDILVSAGEQTYTLQGLKDLIEAGVRMVQPDPIKMGGITGIMQCASLAFAHGVQFVPHQTQPTIAHLANLHVMATVMHLSKPIEVGDGWQRGDACFDNPSRTTNGRFRLPIGPGLGAVFDAAEMERRAIPVS
jgi:D-galactarolactone cycloisomerase